MKRAFLFPGQGSQAIGMGKWLADAEPTARKTFEEADQALGEPLSKLIWEGSPDTLKQTSNAQPAILTVSVAIGRVLVERGIKPQVLAGHSLGEYSALVLSNALRFPDAVRLVRARGKFMQEAVPLGTGTMAAILGASDDLVEIVCREVTEKGKLVEPANYNCPGQLVISGTVEGVALASEELKKLGAKRCIPLEVSAPFHCSLLKPAAEKLSVELKKIEFRDPEVPYVANVDVDWVKKGSEISQKLVDQVWKPVRWTQSLQRIFVESKPDQAIEVGPGKVISGHVKQIDAAVTRFSTDSAEAFEDAVKS